MVRSRGHQTQEQEGMGLWRVAPLQVDNILKSAYFYTLPTDTDFKIQTFH